MAESNIKPENLKACTSINQMTAFKNATSTVAGIAFGLLLVVSVPTMAIVTVGSGAIAVAHVVSIITGNTRPIAFAATVGYFLVFLAACSGDYGLLKLIVKLNKDNK